jgi:hypothetical protein
MSITYGQIYLCPSDNDNIIYRLGESHRTEPRETCTLMLDVIDSHTAELLDRRADRRFTEPENYEHVLWAFRSISEYAGEITDAQIHELYETILSFL